MQIPEVFIAGRRARRHVLCCTVAKAIHTTVSGWDCPQPATGKQPNLNPQSARSRRGGKARTLQRRFPARISPRQVDAIRKKKGFFGRLKGGRFQNEHIANANASGSRWRFSICATAQTSPLPTLTPEERADLYMVRKRCVAKAIDTYRSAGNTAALWNKIGIAYHQLGQKEAAKQSYERAIKLDKRDADAINNLGTIFYSEKKYRTAIALYNKAISISPDAASYWSNLGTAYYARGKFDEMTKAYTRAIQLDPDVFETHGSVGTRMLDRSVEDRARYHYEIARMYATAGKNDLAIQYLRKALEEGFKEKDKLQSKEFSGLREMQEFWKDLMTLEPRVL